MSEYTAGEAYLELENCLEQLELEPITARGLKGREHASTGQRAGAHTSCPRSHPLGNSVDRAPDRGKALCFSSVAPLSRKLSAPAPAWPFMQVAEEAARKSRRAGWRRQCCASPQARPHPSPALPSSRRRDGRAAPLLRARAKGKLSH